MGQFGWEFTAMGDGVGAACGTKPFEGVSGSFHEDGGSGWGAGPGSGDSAWRRLRSWRAVR